MMQVLYKCHCYECLHFTDHAARDPLADAFRGLCCRFLSFSLRLALPEFDFASYVHYNAARRNLTLDALVYRNNRPNRHKSTICMYARHRFQFQFAVISSWARQVSLRVMEKCDSVIRESRSILLVLILVDEHCKLPPTQRVPYNDIITTTDEWNIP